MEIGKNQLQVFLICLNLFNVTAEVQLVFNAKSYSVLCYKSDGAELLTNQNEALEKGPCPLPVAQLKPARHELGVFGDYYTEPPDWVNVTLATIGQNFLRKNFVGFLYYAGPSTLLVGASTDVRRVLAVTGNAVRLKEAAERNLGIILNFLFWANADIVPNPGLSPNAYRWNQSTLFETVNLIRTVHEKAAHQAGLNKHLYKTPIVTPETHPAQLDERLWEALRNDLLASRYAKLKNKPLFPPTNGGTQQYFNQFAMLIQYWALCAPPIMRSPESLIMIGKPTEEELMGYLHYWGFLAHVMGQRPEYNVCLQPNIGAARMYFEELLEEYLIPNLLHLDYETKLLLEVNVKGYADTFPFLDLSIILKQMCEDFFGIEAKHIRSVMPAQSRMYIAMLSYLRRLAVDPQRNSGIRFVMLGLMQRNTLKHFGFNTLRPNEFANGMVASNEKVLANVDSWKSQNIPSSSKK